MEYIYRVDVRFKNLRERISDYPKSFAIQLITTNNCALHLVCFTSYKGSLVAQLVKNLPAMQVTPVRFLGWEDPLEKGLATHSSILTWRAPWTEEPGGLQSM